MTENKNIFQTLKSIILSLTLFLFPLFFLPLTQEYFATAKLYLIVFSCLLLLIVTAVEIATSKKFEFWISTIEFIKILFLSSLLISLIVSSPNKVQALLNPNFGLVAILSLTLLTFYIERSTIIVFKILSFSTLVLSAVTIAFFFQPFRNTTLPFELQFLQNRFFTPLGAQIDLAIFLGFMIVVEILQFILLSTSAKKSLLSTSYYLLTTIITLAAFGLTVDSLLSGGLEQMLPFIYGWYSFTETLKNPLTALVGVGVDNFAAVFTHARDVAFNQSALWQIRSFDVSRSSILHIATESGLLGLSVTIVILIWAFKNAIKAHKILLIPLVYLAAILLFFPPSLTVFFIFLIGLTSIDEEATRKKLIDIKVKNKFAFNLSVATSLLIFSGVAIYLLLRSYLAEFYFKKSIDALARNRGKALYDAQRTAIITNPYIERFHINFSQTNLLLADTIAKKAKTPSEKDKDIITQAATTALAEAKNAIILNPQKASNWENLGLITRNLVNVIEGMDKETIDAYEKAIILDPQNPAYRMSLGSTHFLQGNFSEAVRSFEHAVALKPDWANAHYNLAWALYLNQDSQKAIAEMQAAISLLDPKEDRVDREKAQEDLENMKIQAEAKGGIFPEESEEQSQLLILPTPPVATLEPKLNLTGIATSEAE